MVDEQLVEVSAQYEAIIFLIFPVIMFAIIIKLIALSTGWKHLYANYPNSLSGAPSKMFRWQSARIGWANFNNGVNFGVSQYGLFVKPVAVFNWGIMKPILIPWQDAEMHLTTGFFKTLEITPKKVPNKKIILPNSLYEQIKPEIEAFTNIKTPDDVF